ncbi:MAG TPA: MgtC/SapB family protein [Nitrospirae bacterium]|nr:putative Mg(2+) transport ATPase [bacterium BMS3Abin09]GBE41399.1 putative Mg(2+) transport ATPase [bacterium BMS3Bbin09]HDN94609.1 MgtC/SapB family protein [Nitrospirota bacterium]HDO67069.1 MgtC/SapB family protein [Nitrospirota bacterium]HDZ84591.1 MgtC/SapB family protein [Nitrospirota bacterium]
MIPVQEIIIRLLLGAIIGGIIGFEREVNGRAAGFRTQLIVCVSAVLIMIVSQNYYFHIHTLDNTLRIDPARISAGALIGIGFLGAGVIIKSGNEVRGLTTAASIWIVSAIGLAIGSGLYFEGILTFIITIIALVALRTIGHKIRVQHFKNIKVTTNRMEDAEESIISIINEQDFRIHNVDYEKSGGKDEIIYRFTVSSRNKAAAKQTFLKLNSLDFINTIRISS